MSQQDPSVLGAPLSEFTLPADAADSVTQLIEAAQQGRADAWDQVYRVLYDELYRAAKLQIRRWRGSGPSATSLINRSWLRIDQERLTLRSRQHLVAVMVRAMRYAILDEARRLKAGKRQPLPAPDDPSELEQAYHPELDRMLSLDRALDALSAANARLGHLVELRYFGGLSDVEIAEALGVTDRTLRRDWRRARAFLIPLLGETPTVEADAP